MSIFNNLFNNIKTGTSTAASALGTRFDYLKKKPAVPSIPINPFANVSGQMTALPKPVVAPTLAPTPSPIVQKPIVAPTPAPMPTPAPIVPIPTKSSIQDEIAKRAGETKTAKDEIIAKLTSALSTISGFDPVKRFEELRQEKGIKGLETKAGQYEEEATKTLTLLDELESDIKKRTGEYLVSEPQFRRVEAAERAPLLKQLDITQRGLTNVYSALERGEKGVTAQLELEALKAGIPFESLGKEMEAQKGVNELFKDTEMGNQQRAILEMMGQGKTSFTDIYESLKDVYPDINPKNLIDTVKAFRPETETKEVDGILYSVSKNADGSVAVEPLTKMSEKSALEQKKILAEIGKIEADTAKTRAETKIGTMQVGPGGKNLESVVASFMGQKGIAMTSKNQVSKGISMLKKLNEMVELNPGGVFEGANPLKAPITNPWISWAIPEIVISKKTDEFRGQEAAVRQSLITYITGAAYTSMQEKDVNNYIPRVGLTDAKNKQRINNLYNTLVGEVESQLTANGYSVQLPTTADLFGVGNIDETLSELSDEQIQQLQDEGLL